MRALLAVLLLTGASFAQVINPGGTSGGTGDALTTNPLSQFAATTSAQLLGVMSDETGTGALAFATSPTLVTPVLGVATATSINKMAITAPATSSTLAVADGKTFTINNSITLAGTDSTTITTPTTNATMARTDAAQTFTGAQTFNTGLSTTTYATSQNCSAAGTAASPSAVACSTAPVGSFSCATNATGATCVVATTRVTANSDISLTMDASEGTRLSVTCNTATTTGWYISARTAATSFTVTLPSFTTNPMCFNYAIVN